MIHELKMSPSDFKSVERGEKNVVIKDKLWRGFKRGDEVIFNEFDSEYTDRKIKVYVVCVSTPNELPDNVVFGFRVIKGGVYK